jgi:hypothetical protein
MHIYQYQSHMPTLAAIDIIDDLEILFFQYKDKVKKYD